MSNTLGVQIVERLRDLCVLHPLLNQTQIEGLARDLDLIIYGIPPWQKGAAGPEGSFPYDEK